ncbi:MAG TPA: hypothetical protein VIU34_01745 [Steroidobacter sp.]
MTKNQFRSLVGASIALSLLSAIASVAIAPALPPELELWVTRHTESNLDTLDWFMVAVGTAYLAATTGLFFFARWSRALYAVCVVVLIVCWCFTGPSVTTALETATRDAISLLDGLIIGLVYFSDVRRHFEKRPAGLS